MKIAIFLGLVAVGSLASSQSPSAATVVFPTGKFPDDILRVRTALLQSRDILLKSTDEKGNPTVFNFGTGSNDGGQLRIVKNLSLSGETVHGRQTTILGGKFPIWVREPVQVKISGLCFESPFLGAILLAKSSGAEITNNVIHDVKVLPGYDNASSVGIGATGPEVKGHLLISGNTIDLMEASLSYGIQTVNTDAEIEISHNTLRNIQLNSILCGYPSADVLIYQNRIYPGIGRTKDSIGNGILVGHSRGGHYQIIENTVKCENPNADGIALVGNEKNPVLNSDVFGNQVKMTASVSSAIGFYGLVSHCSIYGNRISGSGNYAFQITVLGVNDTGIASASLFLNNQLSGFSAATATLFLDANAQANIFRGGGVDCIDNGKDNSTPGLKKSKKTPAPIS